MSLAFVYGATFSSLPYFLTLYFQSVRGYSALATGLAFLVPALVVAAGTRAGARAVSAWGVRNTLLGGLLTGSAGVALLGLSLTGDGSYVRLLPGIVLLSLGQGALWTGLWITAAAGVASGDQGIASGMASTSLQVGGAVGLAVLVGLANESGPEVLEGLSTAVYLIAAGIPLGLLAVLAFRRAPAALDDALPPLAPIEERVS
jgi:hypothetical protein